MFPAAAGTVGALAACIAFSLFIVAKSWRLNMLIFVCFMPVNFQHVFFVCNIEIKQN